MVQAQVTNNSLITIGATSATVLPERSGQMKRTQLIITANTVGVVVTIAKGDQPAVANYGIMLQPTGSFVEATDGGYICWQGAVQVIGSAAGTVSVVESFQSEY